MREGPYRTLLALYQGSAAPAELSERAWDEVVRVARRAGLLARLAAILRDRGQTGELPPPVAPVLAAELRLAEAHARNIRWEVRRIREALDHAGVPCVLLKGAAYVLGELPAARGRLFEDVDILVPRGRIDRAESALRLFGWVGLHRHPYDQRYYRRWMHQIPPMRHSSRGTTVDVHHNLLPETGPLSPDPGLLRADSRPLPEWPGVSIPAPEDLILHSAAHLFHDGAMENGLRDLTDLDALVRDFGPRPGFWGRLRVRAELMDLLAPMADALRWSRRLLGTPVPAEMDLEPAATGRSRFRTGMLDLLYGEGLRPDHPLARRPLTGPAQGVLYLRSHTLRMPLRLLAPHLVRKGLRGEGEAR